jgi:hypothetical protein
MNRTLILLPLLLSACAVVHGDGEEQLELRELSEIEGVRNTTQLDLVVDLGLEQSVEVTCDENLLDYVLTELEGQVLVLRTPPGVMIDPVADCYVMVTAPGVYTVDGTGSGDLVVRGAALGLAEVGNSGSGLVSVDGIDTEALEVDNTGSGGVQLAGAAGMADLHNSGSGGIDAQGLVCDSATIKNTGSGDISATVNGDVDVRLSGSGDVELYGEPDVGEVNDSGSGDVLQP